MVSIAERTKLNLPPIAGKEAEILAVVNENKPVFLHQTNLQLENLQSACACALHMHQPTIPAGQDGALISNLQYMFEHPRFEATYVSVATTLC